MIIGTVEIDAQNNLLHAGYSTYRLDVLKMATAPRSYLSTAILVSGALSLFLVAFHDILWSGEIAALITVCAVSLIVGWNFTCLTFHSRDLAGAAVSGALFGTHRHLNCIRRDVMEAKPATSREVQS